MTRPPITCQPQDSRDERLAELAEQLAEYLAVGDEAGAEALFGAHPECADELRRLLPTARLMVDLGRTEAARGGHTPPGHGLPDAHEALSGTLGDFRLVRQIGRGGMGIVYEAEQISLRRPVALKVLPMAGLLDQRHVQRFRNEATAAAGLHHPNIVPVYSVGCERGVHYLAMQLIEGRTLSELIQEARIEAGLDQCPMPAACLGVASRDSASFGTPGLHRSPATTCLRPAAAAMAAGERPSTAVKPAAETVPVAGLSTERSHVAKTRCRTAAKLICQAAEALDYAHSLGVVHRDIKPSNLLLDSQGNLWVADFGLAHLEGNASLTMTGDIMGTLRYMSPEQATGRRDLVDQRSDVYSLGLTLYELLTLHQAFADGDRASVLRRMVEEEPIAPRQLEASIPRDLETIVIKATAKEPAGRYQTAREFAEDLRRFLTDEPVRARRPGLLERTARWSRRHRSLVAAAFAVLLIAMVAFASSTFLIAAAFEKETRHRRVAEGAREEAQHRARVAELARAEEGVARKRAEQAEAESYRQQYKAEMQLAATDWESGNVGRLYHYLIEHLATESREDLRGWEWHYLLSQSQQARTLRGHSSQVNSVCWSPDGLHVATCSNDGTARVWDVGSGALLRSFYLSIVLKRGIAWSPDGNRVAWGSVGDENAVRVWDRNTNMTTTLHGHDHSLNAIDWSPDSRKLLSGSMDGTVRIWDVDVQTCLCVLPLQEEPQHVNAACWSPDGTKVAAVGQKGKVRIWSSVNGELLGERTHSRGLLSAAWSVAGDQLLVGTVDGTCSVLDAKSMETRREVPMHVGSVTCIDIRPDGSIVASAGADGRILGYRFADDQPAFKFQGHHGQATSIAWSPLGNQLVSGGADGTVKIWDVPAKPAAKVFTDLQEPIGSLTWSTYHSGRLRASNATGTRYAEWNVSEGAVMERRDEMLYGLEALSPDGRLRAAVVDTGDGTGTIHIQNARTGQQTSAFGPTMIMADGKRPIWSPDASHLAVFGRKRIELWDVRRHHLIFATASPAIRQVAWAPDGQRLAWVGGGDLADDGTVQYSAFVHVFDIDHSSRVLKLPIAQKRVEGSSVAWSCDGRLLAAGASDGTVAVWRSTDGRPISSGQLHSLSVRSLDWSPDSLRIATGGVDQTVKIWDPTNGEEILSLRDYPSAVTAVKWSPSGQCLAAGYADGQVRVWDASLGYQLTSRKHAAGIYAQMFVDRALRQDREAGAGRVAADFNAAIKIAPDDVIIRKARLAFNAASHRWDAVLLDASEIVDIDPGDPLSRARQAFAYLALGRTEEYRAACEAMLEQLPAAWDQVHAYWALWCCTLIPDSVRDPESAVDLGRKVIANHWEDESYSRESWQLLGAALYRAGCYREAVDALTAGAVEGVSGNSYNYRCYFLAMAHHRLGNAGEAQAWLDKANQHTDDALADSPKASGERLPLSWTRRVMLETLRAEANAVVLPPETRSFVEDPSSGKR